MYLIYSSNRAGSPVAIESDVGCDNIEANLFFINYLMEYNLFIYFPLQIHC